MVAKGQTQNQTQKRKIEALLDQVAVLKDSRTLLAKKLHGAFSFRARYDALKTHTEAAVGEEKYKKIYEKVHTQASDVHKKYTAKHEADGEAHEARLQEIDSLCTTDVERIKKEGAARMATLGNFAILADGSGGAEAGGKKGKRGAATANGEPPKKKKATGPTAYSKFIGDKSVRAAFNTAKETKKTELEWFAWASAQWKTYSAEQKQPYQDQADAAKAEAKAAAEGEASSGEPAKEEPKKKKAVTASPIAAPAGSGKKKEQPLKEAFKRLQKGSSAANGKAPARKAAVDSDEDEPKPTPKQKAKGFVLDEASEGEEDEEGDEDDEEGGGEEEGVSAIGAAYRAMDAVDGAHLATDATGVPPPPPRVSTAPGAVLAARP